MRARLSPRKLLFAAVGAATFAVACSEPPVVGNLMPPPDGRIDAPAGPIIDAGPVGDGPVANLMPPPDAPLSMRTTGGKLA
jgi:hypothetical protein